MNVDAVLASAALAITLLPATANGATTSGSTALALAAVVSVSSPLDVARKNELSRLLDGDSQSAWSAGSIVVKATRIVCRSSNVDVTSRSCALSFGSATRTIGGRLANELTATLEEAGVRVEGAAGTNYVGATELACSVSPATLRLRAGGGATCSFVDL